MDEKCPHCGWLYSELRTGLTYHEVSETLWAEVVTGDRRHKTRHTVLGRWHEIKRKMWDAHLEECQAWADAGGSFEPDPNADPWWLTTDPHCGTMAL